MAEGGPFLERVRDLLNTLAKAQRDYVTYPRNNPVLLKRREELAGKFDGMLTGFPELALTVEAEDLLYEGASVYRNPDRRESIAFHLYRHGIRQIRFAAGLTVDEIDAFIDAVNMDFSGEDLDDDLITVLWTRDAPHFRYDALDDVDPRLPWVRDPAKALQDYLLEQKEAPGSEKFAATIRAEGSQPARDPRADLAAISLSADEVTSIRAMIDDDARRDLVLQVVDILMHVLGESKDPGEARNLLKILERVVEISVDARNFKRAAGTLEALSNLASAKPHLGNALRTTEHYFGQPKQVKMLVEAVSRPAAPDLAPIDELDLFRYLIQLTKAAVVPLAEAMGIIDDRRMRKVFCEAIAELVKDDISLLASLSRDSRWFVARNIAYILGLTKNPDSLRILRSLGIHTNEKVRAEAVRAAATMGGGARDIVHRAVTDADRLVRMLALDLVVAFADATTAPLLLAQITDKSFEERESAEKRALCLAFARIAGEHALNPLSQILVRKGVLGSKDEQRSAAAAGIAAIRTDASTGYLKQGAGSSDAALAAICLQALREAKLE